LVCQGYADGEENEGETAHAGKRPQQGRLSRTVTTDDGDPFAGINLQVSTIEQGKMAERKRCAAKLEKWHAPMLPAPMVL
jgi:hypothetical protein